MGTAGKIAVVLCQLSFVLSALAAPQFAVTPYLQRPATDAMTVIFFTDSACTATTTCTPKNGGGETKTEATTGVWAEALTNNLVCGDTSRTNAKLYRHRVRFTDLKPNRIYAYSVELAGGAKYENSFRTAPDCNTPIRFVAYADCETESNPWDNYVKNLAQMQKRDPDFVAIAGDFVARGGIQSYWDGFWKANAGDKGTIASSIPLLTVLGNHDLYDNGVKGDSASDYKYDLQGETGTERYLAYFENEPNGVEYTVRDGTNIPEDRDLSQLFHRVDYGPVTLIFLDTNDGDNSGDHSRDTNYETRGDTNRYRPGIDRSLGGRHPDFNPGSPQYDWLTNQLADAQQKSRFTFVFNHHCPYSVGSHNNSPTSGQTGGSAQPVRILTETMVRYGVDGWYCGHDELLEHSITNGYEILPDGSKRKHTLSIYDLGCSGDSARSSSGATNPLAYWQGSGNYGGTGGYGFLETDVTTNKNGQWTCTITPVQGSTGNYVSGSQIVYVENSDRGENQNDLVYAEYAKTKPIAGVSATKPLDWLAFNRETSSGGDDPDDPDDPEDPPVGGSPTFSVTPYVQHPATDAMTVIFFTDMPCAASVKCDGRTFEADCEEATALVRNPKFSDTAVHGTQYRHRARLTGLKPGTKYRYEVMLENGPTYANFFKTAPDRDTPVRFVAYSDSETTPTTALANEWQDPSTGAKRNYYVTRSVGFASNLVHMAEWNPDLIVIAGDIAARGGVQQNWDEFWRLNSIAGSVPILAAIGNHDLYDNINGQDYKYDKGGEFALAKYLTYFEFNPNGVDYASASAGAERDDRDLSQLFHREDYGPVTFLFLDTTNGDDSDRNKDTNRDLFHSANNSKGYPRARGPDFNPGTLQYQWLVDNLKDARDVRKSRFIFVVNHHCPYSVGKHNSENDKYNGDEYELHSARAVRVLKDLLMEYGVTAWLCGHDEIIEHSQLEGEQVLADGTRKRHILNIYDLGSAGDGLRGSVYNENPYEVFRPYKDQPEIWQTVNGVKTLVDGGVHYGHLEVEAKPDESGRWTCTLTPVYDFINQVDGKAATFEKRFYHDRTEILESGEVVYEERLGDSIAIVIRPKKTSRQFGGKDPAIDYTIEPSSLNGRKIVLNGALTRVAGEAIGSYDVTLGTLAELNKNYAITLDESAARGAFEVTRIPVTVKADNAAKEYGDVDPSFTATVSGTNGNDRIEYSFEREPGENYGEYEIWTKGERFQGNYEVTFVPGVFRITKAMAYPVDKLTASLVYGQRVGTIETVDGILKDRAGNEVKGSFVFADSMLMLSVGEDYKCAATFMPENDKNYDSSEVKVLVTVQPKELIVKPVDASVVYGGNPPAFSCAFSGFVNGENASVVSGGCKYDCKYQAGYDVGAYDITITSIAGLSAANYRFTCSKTPGTLTVTPKLVTVTAADGSKTYGTDDPAFTAVVTDAAGKVLEDVPVACDALSRTAGENAGTYTIIVTGEEDQGNYHVTFKSGSFRINPARLTSAMAAEMQWTGSVLSPEIVVKAGELDVPASSYTLGSWKKNGASGSIWNPVRIQDIATYTTTVTGSGNFTGSCELEFKIVKADYDLSSIVFTDKTFTYDGKAKSLALSGTLPGGLKATYANNSRTDAGSQTVTVSFSGEDSNHNRPAAMTATLTVEPTALTSAEAATEVYAGKRLSPVVTAKAGTLDATTFEVGKWDGELTNVGTYHGKVTGAGNFKGTVDVAFTVTRAKAVVTADNLSKGYGDKDPDLTATVTGTFNDDTLKYELKRESGEDYGVYVITPSGDAEQGNYSVSYRTGMFTITKVVPKPDGELTAEIEYGTKLSAAAVRGRMVHAGKEVEGIFTFAQPEKMPTVKESGEFAAVFTANDADNFAPANVMVKVTVRPKKLFVRAANTSVIYGTEQPSYGYQLSGFAAGENQDKAGVAGEPTYSSSYTGKMPVGEYEVKVASIGDLQADNYEFEVDSSAAKLKVVRKQVTVTAADTEKTYGEEDPKFTAKVEGIIADESVEFAYDFEREDGENRGTYAIMPFGEAEQDNYTLVFKSGMLTINPATITAAAAASQPYAAKVLTPVVVVKAGTSEVPSDGFTLSNWSKAGAEGGSTINRSIGKYQATVTGKGNYTGTVTVYFSVVKADYDMSGITFADETIVYDGKEHSLAISGTLPSGVSSGAKVTVAGYSAEDLVNVGVYAITVSFNNGDSSHYNTPTNLTATLTIVPATITSAQAGGSTYDGEKKNPVIVAQAGTLVATTELVDDWDGELTDAGTYHARARGTGNFDGELEVAYTIAPATLTEATAARQVYDGNRKTPVLTVRAGNVTAAPNDYDLGAWSGDLVNAGSYTAEVSGKGNFAGTQVVTFVIDKATYSIDGVTFEGKTVTYDGEVHSLAIAGELPAGVSVRYEGNSKTDAGTYAVVAKFVGDAENYNLIADKTATLTIGKAEITSVKAAAATYTGELQTPKLEVKAGELVLQAGDDYTLGAWDGDRTAAGTYAATLTGKGNFTGTRWVEFTINPAPLVITADDQGVEKDADPPPFTATYTGFVNHEGTGVLAGTLAFDCAYDKATAAAGDTFDIIPKGVTADNYDITFEKGVLAVGKTTPKLESLTASAIIYGQTLADSALDGTAMNGVAGTFAWADDTIRPTVAESGRAYDVVFTPDSPDDYTIAHFKTEVTVNPAELTIDIVDADITYGDLPPKYSCEIKGFVNDEDESVISGARKLTCGYQQFDNAGTYAITADLKTFEADNYTFKSKDGTLTVGKAKLAVAAKSRSVTYWDDAPEYEAAYSGFLGTDTVSVVSGAAGFDCDYRQGSAIGSYDIEVADLSQLESANYDFVISDVPGKLTVNRKAVTVVADGQMKTYGTVDTELTATVTGEVGEDRVEYEVTRVAGENVGAYVITASGAAEQFNYSVTYKSATMTITKAALKGVDLAAEIIYGETLGEARITGEVRSVATDQKVEGALRFVDLAAMPVVADSGKAYEAIFTPEDTKSFEPATLSVVVTVVRRELTVKAVDETITFGDEPPAEHDCEITGFIDGEDERVVSGECTYACTYAQFGNVGSYPIEVNVTGLKADNYIFAAAKPAGVLMVEPKPATMTAKDATKTYGEVDPAFELASVEGTLNGDTLTNDFVRAEGEDVREGGYEIRPTGDAVQGNYAVTYVSATLTIEPAKIFVGYAPAQEYTGGELTPQITVTTRDGRQATYSIDPWGEPLVNAKTYVTEVHGTGNFTGDAPLIFEITKATYNLFGITFDNDSVTYDGQPHSLEIGGTLPDGVTVEYRNGDRTDAGEHTITAVFIGDDNHKAMEDRMATLTIKRATITSATAEVATYDGTVKSPVLTVMSGSLPATYVIGEWDSEPKEVGTYHGKVTGTGNFEGSVPVLFVIERARAKIAIENQLKEYNATDPKFSAKVAGLCGDDSVEYTLIRAEGDEPGTYPITVDASFKMMQGNYIVSVEDGTFTITKATPSVDEPLTAAITYGEALGEAPIMGAMKGRANERIDGRFQFLEPERTPFVAERGNFAAVFIPQDTVHYCEVEVEVEVSVAKKELKVRAQDESITFGDEPPNGYDFICEGFVRGEDMSVVSGTCGYECDYRRLDGIGEYPIKVADIELEADNYSFVADEEHRGLLKVLRKSVVVAANDQVKVYGADDPELTVTITGRVDDTRIEYSVIRAEGANVGTYVITSSGDAEQGNYFVTYASGVLTITPSLITEVTARPQKYDGSPKTPVLTVKAGELAATYDRSVWSGELVNAGDYTATVIGNGNFYGTNVVTFTIERADYDMSGVTFDGDTVTYDAKAHTLVIAGELPAGVSVRYLGGNRTDVGEYEVTAEFTGDANHTDIAPMKATLKIAPKPVVVTADDATKTYGATDPDYTATVEGTLAGEKFTYTFKRTDGERVGEYIVTPVGEQLQGNYTLRYEPGTLTIDKAQLTVSPVGAVIRYLDDAPETFGRTFATFAFDDDESVVSGKCTFRCAYVAGDAPGDYDVFVDDVSGLSADNYSFVASASPTKLTVLSVEESAILNAFERFAEINPTSSGWDIVLTNDVTGPLELLDDLGIVVLDVNGHVVVGRNGREGADGEPAIRVISASEAGSTDLTRVTSLELFDSSENNGWIIGGKGGDPFGRGGAGVSVMTNALAGVSVTVDESFVDRVQGGAGGDPSGLPGLAIDNPMAESEAFIKVESAADEVEEGMNIVLKIEGGNRAHTSSVQLQAVYGTASSSDLDLKNVKVNDAPVASFSFPYTFTWNAGMVGEQVIVIPVKKQSSAKNDRDLIFELQNPQNLKLKGVDGKSKNRSQKKVKIKGGKGPVTDKFYVRATPNDATRGKTSGSALVAAGKKVTVKATANKGYVFMDWTTNGVFVSDAASYAFTVTTNVDFVAHFEPLAADYLELKDDFLPSELKLGEVFSNAVTVVSGSQPTISVSGLPTGLKYYAKETVVTDSKTKAKTTVPANTIYGIPTKASATNKTSGVVTPSKVKVTVKNLGGYKIVRTYELRVTAQTTALGTAKVVADDKPYAAVSVALSDDAAGKVTGAGLYQAGKKVTLKATANKGYVFAEWLEDGVNVSSNASYVIASMPSNNVTLVAKFVLPDEIADPSGKAGTYGVAVVRNNDFAGNVTGAGYYLQGKKVTLKATANKGYVFAGWATKDLTVTNQAASLTFTMGTESVRAYAVFVTAGEDLGSIVTDANGMPLVVTEKGIACLATNVMCGVNLQWPVVSTALSLPKVAVSGLPSGLKFTAKDGMIAGAPTKVGMSKVKVTVTTSGKSKAEYQIDLTVDAIPDYAVGTFDGPVFAEDGATNGVVKLTVVKNGKISGTIQTNCVGAAAKKLSLSVASFANYDLATGVFTLVPTYKDGKVTVEVPMTLSAAAVDGGTIGAIDGESLFAYQNVLKGAAATKFIAPELEAYTNLTLTVAKDGVLKIAGKVKDSTDKLISASGTSQIYYDADEAGYRAVIYLPSKKGFDGVVEVVEVDEVEKNKE